MDVGNIAQLISSIGFPIVACIVLFKQTQKQQEQHAEEMSKITESLNNNTLALTRLTAKLGFNDLETEK